MPQIAAPTGAKLPLASAHETEADALAPINDEVEVQPGLNLSEITQRTGGPITSPPRPVNSKKFDDLRDEYTRFFMGAVIRQDRASAVQKLANRALQNQARYESVGRPLGIPWWFIAGIHLLESGSNFKTHLHNGDPLTRQTVHVPPGRPPHRVPPPAFTWEESAKDALKMKKLHGRADWSLPRALHRWELYNGMGYRPRSVPTPYLWSYCSIYKAGKFVADGRFSPTAVSKQCGAAVFLRHLFDSGDVKLFEDAAAPPPPAAPQVPTPIPTPPSQSALPMAFAKKVARNATQLFDRHHLETEDDTRLARQIRKFWESLGLTFPGTSTPWSAVFVSFCVKKAGASATEFKFSPAHSVFVNKAIENAINNTGVFRAFPIDEHAPRIGDIIQNNRGGGRFDFDHARRNKFYSSHSAVVTNVGTDHRGKFAITTGGNESDSVRQKRVPLNSRGLIAQRGSNPYICIIQNLK